MYDETKKRITMIEQNDLIEAIEECERGPCSFQNCGRLANLYIVYDHLFSEAQPRPKTFAESTIGYEGESDFSNAIKGKKALEMWSIMDELMQTIQTIQPRLYDGVMRKISEKGT